MRTRRFLIGLSLVASAVAGYASPGEAGEVRGEGSSSGITAAANDGGGQASARPASTSGDGGGSSSCKYYSVPAEAQVQLSRYYLDPGGPPGTWVFGACAGQANDFAWFPEAPALPPVDPLTLANQALQHTPLPDPRIGMSPKESIPQLVNLVTFLWVDGGAWAPQGASATAGPVTSTVTATPRRVVWSMGNGDEVVCEGPGSPYVSTLSDEDQPNTCRYTYRRSSASIPDDSFVVTAKVEWSVTWTAVGAPGGGNLGVVSRSSSTRVRVAEVQGLNANPQANP